MLRRFAVRSIPLAVALLASMSVVSAAAGEIQQQPLSDTSPARVGLFVSPTRSVEPIKPRETIRVSIRLRNTSTRPLSISPLAISGRGSQDPGSLVDVDPAAAKDPTRNPTSWVRFPFETLTLRARSVATFDVAISAPADARPGAHSVLLAFNVPTTSSSGDAPGVSGVGGAASTIVLRVPGATTPDVRISGVSGPRLVRGGETTRFRARVVNKGDTALDLDAQVQLRTLWGSSGRLLRTDSQLVLPGGRRSIEIAYSDPPLFGRYAPRLTVVGGKGSDLRITREMPVVWVLPPWWFLVALLAALALPIWIWWHRRHDDARRIAKEASRTARARERVERRQEISDAKRRAAEDRRRR